jgi:hypothetical protein
METMSTQQLEAERGHILVSIVEELGGLAHQDMSTAELDVIVDNMLSKGVPNNPSVELQRWIYTHKNKRGFKIVQILGAQVNKVSSIIPECFGRFFDASAVECRACLDRTQCSMKCKKGVEPAAEQSYTLPVVSSQTILSVLQGKNGQIAKTLSHGVRVILEVNANKFKVLSVDNPNNESGQALKENSNMAQTKGAPAKKPVAAVVEEEEVDLSLVDEDEETVEETEDAVETEEVEEAPAKPVKAKKEPKPKPILNKAQGEFQAELNKRAGEDKQKYSAAVAKKLGVKVDEKGDARIDHMLRCMAIKKHLGASKPAAKKA